MNKKLIIMLTLTSFLFACSFSRKKPVMKKTTKAKLEKEMKNQDPVAGVETKAPVKKMKAPQLDWSYIGAKGPENWGDLNAKYVMCKIGKLQSPIDLKWSKPKKGGNIQTFYKTTSAKIELLGNHFRLRLDPGNRVVIRGQDYDLKYVEIHSPSEHSLSSSRTSLEVQLIHHNNSGQVAVLSSLAIEGKSHPVFEKIWSAFSNLNTASIMIKLNPEDLIPQIRTHYHYVGSATSPPCFEGVNWNVFNTPVTLSREQILSYRSTFKDNARPLQPRNKRRVINY